MNSTEALYQELPLTAYLPEELVPTLSLQNAYQGRQLFRWIQKGCAHFVGMTDLPKGLRDNLEHSFRIRSSFVESRNPDADGSTKYRIRLRDGCLIESVVLMDRRGRATACLSTQVGCGMGCRFCATAQMGLARDLNAGEIVEQFLLLSQDSGGISHIVFMGMGEPLSNLQAVRKSVQVLTHPEGRGLSLRRITISTCGIVDGICELAQKGPFVRLAVSLVSADPALRRSLMPSSAANGLPDIKHAMLQYQRATEKRITAEVVLMGGINDRPEDARMLRDYLPPLKAIVNLLPWNPVPHLPYRRPSTESLGRFKDVLQDAGIPVTQRYRRGGKVGAACGQLCILQDSADPSHAGGR